MEYLNAIRAGGRTPTLDEIRPQLQRDHGDVELIDVDGKNIYVKMTGACSGCYTIAHSPPGCGPTKAQQPAGGRRIPQSRAACARGLQCGASPRSLGCYGSAECRRAGGKDTAPGTARAGARQLTLALGLQRLPAAGNDGSGAEQRASQCLPAPASGPGLGEPRRRGRKEKPMGLEVSRVALETIATPRPLVPRIRRHDEEPCM